jgi:pilus assembly protein CpaE
MEQELGEAWGDLNFEDALVFLKQPDSTGMQFVAIAVDCEDESELTKMNDVIKAAKAKKIKVLLIANQVSPSVLYQMQKLGRR